MELIISPLAHVKIFVGEGVDSFCCSDTVLVDALVESSVVVIYFFVRSLDVIVLKESGEFLVLF
jgi:hypothetical protein